MKNVEARLLSEIGFHWNVMRKIFKPCIWVNECILVKLSKSDMTKIKNKVEDSRSGNLCIMTINITNNTITNIITNIIANIIINNKSLMRQTSD